MTNLTDQLDAIQKRKDAATEGPWRTWKDDGGRRGSAVETAWAHDADGADTELITDWCSLADAEFIANAPTDIGFLLVLARKQQAAINAVRALHTEDLFRGHLSNGCRICGGGVGWPCPTIKALEAKP